MCRTHRQPIFVFSTNGPTPVFVDRRYRARNACGMVIAVQSPHASTPGRLACNGQSKNHSLPKQKRYRNEKRSCNNNDLTPLQSHPQHQARQWTCVTRHAQSWQRQ